MDPEINQFELKETKGRHINDAETFGDWGADDHDDTELEILQDDVNKEFNKIRRDSIKSSNSEKYDTKDRSRSATVVSGASDHKVKEEYVPYFSNGFILTVFLFALGLITGIVNGVTMWVIRGLLMGQAQLLMSNKAGPFCIMVTTSVLCALSSLVCRYGDRPAAIGTGMPEVKALLATEFHHSEYPMLVSFRIQFIRLLSVILAFGSGLSIGSAASLAHSTVCTAYNLMKYIPEFGYLLDSPSMTKQIFAAACAVGLTTVFNAPIGGLLFSIEVTSTYYLMSNYWNSFFAATVGAVTFYLILSGVADGYRTYGTSYDASNMYSLWEFPFQIVLGLIIGVFSYFYLFMHQKWFLYSRPYIEKYPEIIIAIVGAFTALMIYAIGAYNSEGMGLQIVLKDLYSDGVLSQMESYNVQPAGGLFVYFLVFFVLIMISTHHLIAWGVFLPDLVLGGIFGRMYGLLVQKIVGPSNNVYLAGYAMMGSVGFLSGTTHTTSCAVMIVEMTGQLDMLLPCLIVAVCASAVTKSRTLSLYDQDMINKGMESFQLLFNLAGNFRFAGDIMDSDTTYIATTCQISDLFKLLENKKQVAFPVIDDAESCKLVGSLSREDIYKFLKTYFAHKNALEYIAYALPYDMELDNERIKREEQMKAHQQWLEEQQQSHSNKLQIFIARVRSFFQSLIGKVSSTSKHSKELDEDGVQTSSRASLTMNQVYRGHKDFAKQQDIHHLATSKPFEDNESDEADDVLNPLQQQFKEKPSTTNDSITNTAISFTDIDSNKFDMNKINLIMDKLIDIYQQKLLPLNRFPRTCHVKTPMEQIYILFEMVKVKSVFVLGKDKYLEGMISEEHLVQNLKKKMKTS